MRGPEDSSTDAAQLAGWLRRHGVLPDSRTALAGDVSRREYSRYRQAGAPAATVVLASYPPEQTEVCARFATTTALLQGLAVRVPEILAQDCARGWMLVEDLGPHTLYDLEDKSWDRIEGYFRSGIEVARRVATLRPRQVATLSPPLDRVLLERELRQTREMFLEPEGLLGEPADRAVILAALQELCGRLGTVPAVPCHRDLMARNLVPLGPPGDGVAALGVLDHQDLRLGPPGYDVASLLNDSLFPPAEREQVLLAEAFGTSDGSYRAYHRAAAQRTLKAVGTYAAFARRGSHRHLRLIRPTFTRALHHLERLPEMSEALPVFQRCWCSHVG
jgi:hypothetical protein